MADVVEEVPDLLAGLNHEQRRAVTHGHGPLLVIAGAGTGKTTTLARRVAHLLASGVAPGRMLLLTFARRAAAEMIRRVDALVSRTTSVSVGAKMWSGTYHAIATRLLRAYGDSIGLGKSWSILDRADCEDLLQVLRTELSLGKNDRRFPGKGTCLEIYSHCVNARRALDETLTRSFPWCEDHADDLRRLFRRYGERKGELSLLDYDDLLLFWRGLLADPSAGAAIRAQFDCVLVDEYQDTNVLQAEILRLLRPDGTGVTVVGDDAQSIYSFRAATVRNILDFPLQYPGTTCVTLEENYRSTPGILTVSNRVIAEARERFVKHLHSRRADGEPPVLATCRDEAEQTSFVIGRILANLEAGVPLRQQAVLFRTAHHSLDLELELARRKIPFHKFGGLKFAEAAHIKDLVAFLRLAENPRDVVAGTRVLLLLPGVGPKRAHELMSALLVTGGRFEAWATEPVTRATQATWPAFVALLGDLAANPGNVAAQIQRIRQLYQIIADGRYDNLPMRLRDFEQLERIAQGEPDRASFLTGLALDPPGATQDLAGPPVLDEDYLVLSTIHSAKGLEWDSVFLLHAADGNIPSDLMTGSDEAIEEERRLLYVALTRAKNQLHVCFPLRYYSRPTGRSDRHTYAQLSRFISDGVRAAFVEHTASVGSPEPTPIAITSVDLRRQVDGLWD